MQPTTVHTELQKRKPLHFLVDGLQVWATYLDAKHNGPFGVRFMWMEDQYACSPLNHITMDNGNTYHQFESYVILHSGVLNMHITVQENDREKVSRLQNIWDTYESKLSEAGSMGETE